MKSAKLSRFADLSEPQAERAYARPSLSEPKSGNLSLAQDHRIARMCSLALLFAASVISAVAQSDSPGPTGFTATGFPENGVFEGSTFDMVQMNNGNLHLQIRFLCVSQRGHTQCYVYSYDNQGWYYHLTTVPSGGNIANPMPELFNAMQWRMTGSGADYWLRRKVIATTQCGSGTPDGSGGCSKNPNAPPPGPIICDYDIAGFPIYGRTYSGYVLYDPDGTKHGFTDPNGVFSTDPSRRCPGPDDSSRLYATDGSGWVINQKNGIVSQIIGKNGTQLVFQDDGNGSLLQPASVTDRNGNSLLGDGRPIGGWSTDPNTGISTFSYFDTQGTTRNINVSFVSVPVQTNLCPFSLDFGCKNEYRGAWNQPSLVQLPNGLTYQFTYEQNQYGEPNSVTLPSGATISWTWGSVNHAGRKVTSRTVVDAGQSATWNYFWGTASFTNTWQNNMVDPAGNETVYTCQHIDLGFPNSDPDDPSCNITKIQYYQGRAVGGTLLKTVQTDYCATALKTGNCSTPLPVRETVTLNDTNQVSKVETDWDSLLAFTIGANGVYFSWRNPVERRQYDWGNATPGSPVRRTHYDYLHLNNTTYQTQNLADFPTSVTVYDGNNNIVAQTQNSYDQGGLTATSGATNHDYANFSTSNTTRGNLTQESHWRNTDGAWLNTSHTYDDLGHIRSTTDANGNPPTTFSYDDNWANTNCVPAAVNTQAYVTQVTNALGQKTKTLYYPCTGLPQAHQDQNDLNAGRSGTTFTYDLMNRLLCTNFPDGGQTCFDHHQDALPLKITKTVLATPDPAIIRSTQFDDLGRPVHTSLDSAPGCVPTVDTTYDALGRVSKASNPHCPTASATDGVTTTFYDALNRVSQINKQDGSISTLSYSGNCATSTDEAGKQRKSCTDGLGRLVTVFEDPNGLNYETDYQYDALGNLLRVDQKGSAPTDSSKWRTRLFTYDSLSRLLTAYNPESGTISYSYDANGNVKTRTGPAANQTGSATVTTTYVYDALNRMTSKTYSDSTPSVTYGYDVGCCGVNPQNGVGRMTYTMSGNTELVYVYDPMGRITEQADCPPSGIQRGYCYAFYAYYDLAGDLTYLSYPDGQTAISYTPDSAGRDVSAVDNAGLKYVNSATYGPDSSLTGFISGQTGSFGGITNSFSYNNRLQPVFMSASVPTQTVFSIGYDFHAGNGTAGSGSDNGNVYSLTNNRDHTRDQAFTYDLLNRLISAQNAGTDCTKKTLNPNQTEYWGNSYGYDAWGNLLSKSVTKCSAENLSETADSQNRMHAASGADYSYDATGNMTHDATTSNNYTYDQENRITFVNRSIPDCAPPAPPNPPNCPPAVFTASYTYNSLGNRVRKDLNGGPSTEYFFFNGQPLAELNPATGAFTNYVFFDGDRVARRNGPTGPVSYYFSDNLKTASVITDAAGNIQSESDYYPWGGELSFVANDSNHYKFTGKERDSETQLDYFGARYYSNGLGRFITPDWAAKPAAVPYAVLGDPQTLNLYTYVRNIPTSNADLDGHCETTCQIAKGVAIGVGKFVWNNMPWNGGQHAMDLAKLAQKNPEAARAQVRAEIRSLGTVAQAISGDIRAQVQVGTGVANAWNNASNTERASAVTQGVLIVGTAVAGGVALGAEEGAVTGGRLGSAATRAQNAAIADSLESRGFTITGGGGRLPEEYIPGPGGGTKGSTYVDISAERDGHIVRVQTVDTLADGVTPTTREADAAARIRSQQQPGDHTVLIPKKDQ